MQNLNKDYNFHRWLAIIGKLSSPISFSITLFLYTPLPGGIGLENLNLYLIFMKHIEVNSQYRKLNNIPTSVFLLFPNLSLDIDNLEDISVILCILAHHKNEKVPQSQNIFLFFFIDFLTRQNITLSELFSYKSHYRNTVRIIGIWTF